MFQHILVPVDFTEKNRRALDIAINLARVGQGTVSVLHVIELIFDTPVEESTAFYSKLEKQAAQKMKALLAPYTATSHATAQTRETGVKLEQKIIYGSRVQAITHFAQEQAIDLIVMNSHKIDLNEPTHGWGTISYKVSVLADCPVLLVK